MTSAEADDTFDEFEHLAELARECAPTGLVPRVCRKNFETAGGAVLSALVWGEGAPDVVFLHGAGLHAHSWDATALALGVSAIAFDLPGHGDSSWRDGHDYGPEQLAIPLSSVLSTVLDKPIVVVGQSLGGLVAIPLATLLGELVSALVLVDVTPGHRIAGTASSAINEFMSGASSYESRDAIIDRAIDFGFGSNRNDLARGVRLNTRVRADGRVVFKHHFAILPPDIHALHDVTLLWPTLQALELETLLVRGSRGILDEGHVRELTTLLPRAEVITLEAGHNVQRDDPKRLAESIANLVGATRSIHGR